MEASRKVELPADLSGRTHLTWHTLDIICEILRNHGSVEILCPQNGRKDGPYLADIVVELAAVKP